MNYTVSRFMRSRVICMPSLATSTFCLHVLTSRCCDLGCGGKVPIAHDFFCCQPQDYVGDLMLKSIRPMAIGFSRKKGEKHALTVRVW